jgi:hypothetical protein
MTLQGEEMGEVSVEEVAAEDEEEELVVAAQVGPTMMMMLSHALFVGKYLVLEVSSAQKHTKRT